MLAAIAHDEAGALLGSVPIQLDAVPVLTAELHAILWARGSN